MNENVEAFNITTVFRPHRHTSVRIAVSCGCGVGHRPIDWSRNRETPHEILGGPEVVACRAASGLFQMYFFSALTVMQASSH